MTLSNLTLFQRAWRNGLCFAVQLLLSDIHCYVSEYFSSNEDSLVRNTTAMRSLVSVSETKRLSAPHVDLVERQKCPLWNRVSQSQSRLDQSRSIENMGSCWKASFLKWRKNIENFESMYLKISSRYLESLSPIWLRLASHERTNDDRDLAPIYTVCTAHTLQPRHGYRLQFYKNPAFFSLISNSVWRNHF